MFKRIKETQKLLEVRTKSLENAEDRITELVSKVNNRNKLIKDMEEQAKELYKENKQLQSENEDLKNNIEFLRTKLTAKNKELVHITDEN